jgi:hypothetical protein
VSLRGLLIHKLQNMKVCTRDYCLSVNLKLLIAAIINVFAGDSFGVLVQAVIIPFIAQRNVEAH